MKVWKEICAAEVRQLAVGSRVEVHGHDRHGIPYIMDCEVVEKRRGAGKELRYDTYDGFERMPIKDMNGRMFKVEEDEHDA